MSDRQSRERDYHAQHAKRHQAIVHQPVIFDVIQSAVRRPWNAYWSTYDILKARIHPGMRMLVPGCGFGTDAILLATLGAQVSAFDLSPDVLDIATTRARNSGVNIDFGSMPAEAMTYPDGYFDGVFFNDILHHVDIPEAIKEVRRVVKPGGLLIANELYTHSAMQRFRNAPIVTQIIYPRMKKFIYGATEPYITEDEHKIDESELATVTNGLHPGYGLKCFMFLGGRILPSSWRPVAKFDSLFLQLAGGAGLKFAGRILLDGTIN
jgi:ubiquinone/menaquinone biosynthesis C-methylase UbiE